MEFLTLIESVGFPILACVVMAWYVKYITDKNYEETKELNEQHTREMLEFKNDMQEALNNNTRAIEKLCDKISGKEG